MIARALRTSLLATFASALVTAPAAAQSGSTSVPGAASLWYAGLGSPNGDGLLPISITLTPGLARVMTVSNVTGQIGCCSNATGFFPDGSQGGQTMNALNGISGINLPGKLALLGVFLDGTPGAAPGSLNFATGPGINFLTLAPVVRQSFFIGDGLTSTNVQQQFFVPDAATTLYLGIPDACGFNGNGNSCYSDNFGSFGLSYDVTATVVATPEPASVALLATGLVGVLGAGYRRRRAA